MEGETEKYIRLAYSGIELDQIKEGLGKLKEFIEKQIMVCCNTFDKFAWIYHPFIKLTGKPKKYYQKIKSIGEIKNSDSVLGGAQR